MPQMNAFKVGDRFRVIDDKCGWAQRSGTHVRLKKGDVISATRYRKKGDIVWVFFYSQGNDMILNGGPVMKDTQMVAMPHLKHIVSSVPINPILKCTCSRQTIVTAGCKCGAFVEEQKHKR